MLCRWIHSTFFLPSFLFFWVSFYSSLASRLRQHHALPICLFFLEKLDYLPSRRHKERTVEAAAKTNYYKNTSSLNLNTVKALALLLLFSFSTSHIHVVVSSRLYVIEGSDMSISHIKKHIRKISFSCEMEINVSELKVYFFRNRRRRLTSCEIITK